MHFVLLILFTPFSTEGVYANGTNSEAVKDAPKEGGRKSRHSLQKEAMGASSVSPREAESPLKLRMQIKLLTETLGSIQGLQDDMTTQYTTFKQGFAVKEAELKVAASRVSELEKVLNFIVTC